MSGKPRQQKPSGRGDRPNRRLLPVFNGRDGIRFRFEDGAGSVRARASGEVAAHIVEVRRPVLYSVLPTCHVAAHKLCFRDAI